MAIVVGSVAVEVVPSAAGFRQALSAQLRDLKVEVDVDIDVAGAIAKLEGVREALDDIGDIDIDVDTDIDLAGALAELEALRALLDSRTPSIDIPVNIDKGGHALRQAGFLSARLRAIVVAALSLGPALIPLAAALTAVFAAISVPLAAATAGIGAFAVFAIPAISKVTKASDKLAAAQKKVDNALTSKQRETALKRQAQLLDSLDAPTRAAVVSLNNLKTSFKNFQRSLQPAIFEVFNAGLNVANAGLPLLASLARITAPILTELADRMAKALASPEVKRFVAFLGAQAGPAIRSFATILGSLAKGFANLLVAFAPLTPRIMAGIERLAKGFENMAQSQGFRDFLAYAVTTLPKVARFMGALVGAVGALLGALAPFGDFILETLTGLLHVIDLLAEEAPVLTVALVLAAAALLLFSAPVAAIVLGVLGLVAAFKHLYHNSAPVRAVIGDLAEIFRDLAERAMPKIKAAFEQVQQAIRTAIEIIGKAIEDNRPQIDKMLQTFRKLGEFLVDYLIPLIGTEVVVAFLALGIGIATAIEVIATAVDLITGYLETFRKAVLATTSFLVASWLVITAQFQTGTDTVGSIWDAFWGTRFGQLVQSAFSLVASVITFGWAIIIASFQAGTALIRGLWEAFWGSEAVGLVQASFGLINAIITLSWALITAAFQIGTTVIRTLMFGVFGDIARYVQVTMSVVQAVVRAAFQAVLAVILSTMSIALAAVRVAFGAFGFEAERGSGRVVSVIGSLPGRILSALGNLGGLLVGAGRDLISGLISGITDRIGELTGVLNRVTSLIKEAKGPPAKDKILLTPAGHQIMQGLIRGIEAEEPALLNKLQSLTSRIGMTPGLDGLAVAGVAGPANGPSYVINARSIDLNERTLGERLYAIELRERVSRPR